MPELAHLGLTARALDLPGHGPDHAARPHHPRPLRRNDPRHPQRPRRAGRPFCLSGYAIAAAALKRPDLVRALIYLTAWIPAKPLLADLRRAARPEALTKSLRLAPDRRTYSFAPESYASTFAQDALPDDLALARRNLCPEPVAPHETPLPATPETAAFAIFCDHDRAIPPALQRQLAATILPDRTATLPASHSPSSASPKPWPGSSLASQSDAIRGTDTSLSAMPKPAAP
ncbi:MAG: hypothetical protein HZT43_13755 [Exiguobacterium profundum]|nr:MAG: hypothetical protein HZT43_13755 [Exiguobacterium profundum]